MDAPALVAVARNCPSGAITYRARDSTLDERAPPVNAVRLREHGPSAFNADLVIKTADAQSASALRRTLCRCGASGSKPFCDDSHAKVGFRPPASGAPRTIGRSRRETGR
jgi:CDGSH-type Zn-finger protein